jgi:hypothetical protein
MVIRYFHIDQPAAIPVETNPPLLIDPNTVLAFPIT